jgi:hypothetical protein
MAIDIELSTGVGNGDRPIAVGLGAGRISPLDLTGETRLIFFASSFRYS